MLTAALLLPTITNVSLTSSPHHLHYLFLGFQDEHIKHLKKTPTMHLVLRQLCNQKSHSFNGGWGNILSEKLKNDEHLRHILFYYGKYKIRTYWNGRYVAGKEEEKDNPKPHTVDVKKENIPEKETLL